MTDKTLRDDIAIAAMAAFLSQSHPGPEDWTLRGHGWGEDCANNLNQQRSEVVRTLAGFSYRVADAMLEARQETET